MSWAVVNLRAVVNIEDVDNMVLLVDPIHDAVGAASGPMTAIERPQQRLADPVRVTRKPGIAKLQRGGSNSTFPPLAHQNGWLTRGGAKGTRTPNPLLAKTRSHAR